MLAATPRKRAVWSGRRSVARRVTESVMASLRVARQQMRRWRRLKRAGVTQMTRAASAGLGMELVTLPRRRAAAMQARPQKRLLMGERAPLAKLRVERVRLPLAGMPPAKALAALARPQARRSWWGLAAEPARPERDLPMTELSSAAMKAMAQAGPVRVPIHEGRRAHEKPDHEGRRSSGWKPSRKRTE